MAGHSTAEWRQALVEIIPGLLLLPGEKEGRFPFAHSFLVEGDARALIDTGAGIERLRRLCNRAHLDMIIASHSHPDHTAGNWLFDDLPIHAPRQAADTFGRLAALSERFTESGPLAETWRRFIGERMGFRDAQPTHTFDDNHHFDFGKVRFVAFHAPGHMIDHTCFFEPTHGVLLSFDIDLTSFGPWYGHRESDIEQFKTSIRRVMALRPKIVISSHMGIIKDGVQARLSRFLAVFDEREAMIRRLMEAGYSLTEMVDLSPIYGGHRFAPELLRYWEEQMIRKHIELIQETA